MAGKAYRNKNDTLRIAEDDYVVFTKNGISVTAKNFLDDPRFSNVVYIMKPDYEYKIKLKTTPNQPNRQLTKYGEPIQYATINDKANGGYSRQVPTYHMFYKLNGRAPVFTINAEVYFNDPIDRKVIPGLEDPKPSYKGDEKYKIIQKLNSDLRKFPIRSDNEDDLTLQKLRSLLRERKELDNRALSGDVEAIKKLNGMTTSIQKLFGLDNRGIITNVCLDFSLMSGGKEYLITEYGEEQAILSIPDELAHLGLKMMRKD